MAFVIRFLKGVRNHWKKSTVAAIALTYGINYVKEYMETQDLMRVYCRKAALYGQQPLMSNKLPRTITVILNPNANKRKATTNFEKYCAPILNLAGICVEVIQTESEGHAKTLIDTVGATDAIVIAGGDGTLSEVVTGLLRRTGENKHNLLPIGVLPLGRSNSVAKSLFPGGNHLESVRSLADASLAIVEEVIKPVDVMRIEVVDENEDLSKPVYAVSGIEWGAYRDAQVKKDSYWYFGSLRRYVTYIFNGYKNSLSWNCEATVKYSMPCEGCSNCYIESKQADNRRWYHKFLSNKSITSNKISAVVNEKCKETYETTISTSDLMLLTSNIIPEFFDGPPKLLLQVGPNNVNYFDFVSQGWQSEQGRSRAVSNTIEARQIEIKPSVLSKEEKESWFSIDKEDYEVKPVRVTLLPKFINMYCKKDDVKSIK